MGADYPALFERLARIADVLKASEEDLAAIYPGMPLARAVQHVRALAPTAMLLITRGKDGMQLLHGEASFMQASLPVTVADTVGAGDACLGGFLASLLGTPAAAPADHLRFAAATAAAACARTGAHAPTREEVLALLPAGSSEDRAAP